MSLFDDMMDVQSVLEEAGEEKKYACEAFDKVCAYLNRVEAEAERLQKENEAMRAVITICGEPGG